MKSGIQKNHPSVAMTQITSLLFQLVFGSARLRALGAGLLIGAVAHVLAARTDGGLLAPAFAAAVILGGLVSVLQITLDNASRRDAASLRRLAEWATICVGGGILVMMYLPAWLA